jgi:ADP-heptose:LPS heptosyltransferase
MVFQSTTYGKDVWFKLFQKLGIELEDRPSFYFTKQGKMQAKKFIKSNKIKNNEKLVFLHPGAGTIARAKKEKKIPSHEWPNKKWASLANKILRQKNIRIIFTGSVYERSMIKEIIYNIEKKHRVIDSSSKFSLEGIASLMKKGNVLVSVDTGMVHIGAQAGIHVVDLCGPFDPNLVQPWTTKKTMIFNSDPEICTKCRKYYCPEKNPICMNSISVEKVYKATELHL